MLGNQPVKVVYIQQPIPVRKKSRRSPFFLHPHNNQVVPCPVFTCIDEIYSPGTISQPPVQPTHTTSFSSSQKSTDDTTKNTTPCRKWLLIIIIIVIIVCIITIIVLLAVFLTR